MTRAEKKKSDPDLEIEIHQMGPEHKFSGLSMGDNRFTPLKTFVKKHALEFEQQSLARTYVACIKSKQIAYVTILCGEVSLEIGDSPLQVDASGYRYLQYPAVKIARLAVDSRFRGHGIGEKLLDVSLGISQRYICPWVGCRFIMVDAKKESVSFYEKYGFTLLDTSTNRNREEPIMFIDLMKSAK